MITKSECSALRGIAIIAICLHNYCHLLPNSVQENEFSYDAHNFFQLGEKLFSYDFLIQMFSFWGHLGVPIFVFLSGYGLSRKYNNISVNRNRFFFNHFKKLAIPLIIGTLFFLIILFFKEGGVYCSPVAMALQLSMLLNLFYGYEDYIIPGPYWYFGMTLQLYIIYIIFIYKQSIKLALLPLITSIILTLFLKDFKEILIWTKYNCIGWLMPFYLGLYAKYIKNTFIKKLVLHWGLFVSFLIIAIFETNFYLWIWIPLITIIPAVFFIKLIHPKLLQLLENIGKYSLIIFVIHPIIREITIPIAYRNYPFIGLSAYCLGTMFVTLIVIFLKNMLFQPNIIKK